MKKLSILLLLVGTACGGLADIVTNLLLDPGFENFSGNAPDTNSAPWTAIEPTTWPVIQVAASASATQHYHGGSNAVVFQYYNINPTARLYQNTGTLIEAGKDYEVSVWALIDDKSSNVNHTNSTTFNIGIYTSDTIDGTYTYRTGDFNLILSNVAEWEQLSTVFTAAQLSDWTNQYIRVVFTRPNNNTEYRLYFDDASFGEVIPEPATIGLLGIGSCLAFWFHGRRLRAQA